MCSVWYIGISSLSKEFTVITWDPVEVLWSMSWVQVLLTYFYLAFHQRYLSSCWHQSCSHPHDFLPPTQKNGRFAFLKEGPEFWQNQSAIHWHYFGHVQTEENCQWPKKEEIIKTVYLTYKYYKYLSTVHYFAYKIICLILDWKNLWFADQVMLHNSPTLYGLYKINHIHG